MTIQEFALENISSEVYKFDVDFRGLGITLNYSKQREEIKKKVEADFALMQQRSEAIKNREGFKFGDYIKFKDGRYERLTVLVDKNCFQAGDGAYHAFESGSTQHSGSGGEMYRTEVRLTEEFKEGSIWFFSGNDAGGGRGIQGVAMFKVWEEI